MSHNWILDVLADLRSFALRNDLTALAEQLDDTTLVAATEIASKEGKAQAALNGNAASDRKLHRSTAGHGDA